MTNAQITVFTDMVETVLIEKSIVPSIAKGLYNASSPIVRGAAIDILGTEDITIGQYSGTITHQTLAGTSQTVAIANVPYYSVKLDGVADLATAPENTKVFVTGKAGKTLALDLDGTFAALISKASVTVSGVVADIDSVFVGAATALDEANVGMNDRAIVLDPATINKLISEQGAALNSEKSADIVYEGYIGKYMGMEVFKSNSLTSTTTVVHGIALDMTALVLPRNYDETREITDATFFGVAVQGVVSYGLDIIETATGESNRLVQIDVDHA